MPEKPKPVTKEEQRGGEFKVFAKHRFAGKGDVDPVLGVVEEVKQVEGAEVEGGIALEKKKEIEVWVRSVEEDGTVAKDAAGEEKELVSPMKEKAGERSRAANIAAIAPMRDAKKQSGGISPVKAATDINFIPPHLRRLFAAPVPAAQRGSLLDMDIEDNLSLTLQPLSLLPTALMAPIVPTAPVKPIPNSTAPPSGLPQPLIESLTSTPKPLIETLQTTSEPTTRVYHHTMNQHAAPNPTSKGHWAGNTFVRAAPPSLLSTTFISSLHTATAPLLHALRGWRGAATLEVKIGRIWISDAVLALSESDTRGTAVVDGRKVARWFEGGRRAGFSALVSGEAADAQFLADMKLSGQDERFWGKTPRWGVEYQFSCVDPRVVGGEGGQDGEGRKFTVTVDAETFRWRCETGERCLGEVWGHCLKRVWDFKVSATGRKEVDGEYKEIAGELVEGLYIP